MFVPQNLHLLWCTLVRMARWYFGGQLFEMSLVLKRSSMWKNEFLFRSVLIMLGLSQLLDQAGKHFISFCFVLINYWQTFYTESQLLCLAVYKGYEICFLFSRI